MSEGQVLVPYGQDHLPGHPEAIMAKQVLLGQKVIVMGYEDINISRNFYRNKLMYLVFLHKQMNINPLCSPYHFRMSSQTFWQTAGEKADGGSCCPQDCVSEAYTELLTWDSWLMRSAGSTSKEIFKNFRIVLDLQNSYKYSKEIYLVVPKINISY
uniref:Uncharacterized protein n=1 Tax=Suricata suricatta TaxID=37032 RepID=A0A673T4H6_SURSU